MLKASNEEVEKVKKELTETITQIFEKIETHPSLFRDGKKVKFSENGYVTLYVDKNGVYGSCTINGITRGCTKEQILNIAVNNLYSVAGKNI